MTFSRFLPWWMTLVCPFGVLCYSFFSPRRSRLPLFVTQPLDWTSLRTPTRPTSETMYLEWPEDATRRVLCLEVVRLTIRISSACYRVCFLKKEEFLKRKGKLTWVPLFEHPKESVVFLPVFDCILFKLLYYNFTLLLRLLLRPLLLLLLRARKRTKERNEYLVF